MHCVEAKPLTRVIPVLVALAWASGCTPPMLAERGMRGTFYVIGGYLGHSGYLTVDQARALEQAGHEIGGHTMSHPHLPEVSLDDALLEICQDRATQSSVGTLTVDDFAVSDEGEVTR